MKKYFFFFLFTLLAACSKVQKIPLEHVHYVVGSPYPLGATWMYPEEKFAYHITGLAEISTRDKGSLTTDGELYNSSSMTGGHPTLQLPAIVTVRNLDNGRQIVIRLNDRHVSSPARILSLSPTAASLLGMNPHIPAKVEIIEDENQSRTIAFQLPNGPQLLIATAPIEAVQQEDLNSPSPVHKINNENSNQIIPTSKGMKLPDLPAIFTQGAATGGQLWIDGGSFTSRTYAYRLASQMNGRLVSVQEGGRWVIHARSGPFHSVEEADQQLDHLLKAGIKGAKIVVE